MQTRRLVLLIVAAVTVVFGSMPVWSMLIGDDVSRYSSEMEMGEQFRPSRVSADDPVVATGFDGERAYQVLKEICELGPRISGTQAMRRQQTMLVEHFEALGATTRRQEFDVNHPQERRQVTLTNLIVEWYPDRRDRILICAHYDTRPFPDRDPVNPYGVFLGANDGASGVSVLHELGRHVRGLQNRYGVDFVFFDAEEFIYEPKRDQLFLGSTHFARRYASQPRQHRYVAGVLLDMVGDADLNLYYERNSMRYARWLAEDIWRTAQRMSVREFIPQIRHEIRDDHIPLNEIGGIPTVNIIDFDYPSWEDGNAYWHTKEDTPDKCSPESLAKVGAVLIEWLKQVEIDR